jgi:hypothetical protein
MNLTGTQVADNTVRGRESTRVIAEAAVSRSSAIEMRSAQDHQYQLRPSLPWLT